MRVSICRQEIESVGWEKIFLTFLSTQFQRESDEIIFHRYF